MALACVREWTWWVRTVILTTTVLSRFTMLTGTVSKKNYVDRAGRQRRGERTKAEDKVLWPMCWAGLGILIKNKNGPELFTTLTMICMGPLVAGRKSWEKED